MWWIQNASGEGHKNRRKYKKHIVPLYGSLVNFRASELQNENYKYLSTVYPNFFCFHNSWTYFSVNIFYGHICSPTSTLYCLPVFSQFCFSNYIIFGISYDHPSPHVRLFHVIMAEATINISHTCLRCKSLPHICNLGYATSNIEHNLKPHCLWYHWH